MPSDIYKNSYIKMWIQESILHVEFTPEVIIDLGIAKQIVKDRLNYTKGDYYPVVVDIQKIKSVDRAARSYFATEEASSSLKAAALLASSYVDKMIGTFFLTFNRPKVPIRLFTNKNEALKWLQVYK